MPALASETGLAGSSSAANTGGIAANTAAVKVVSRKVSMIDLLARALASERAFVGNVRRIVGAVDVGVAIQAAPRHCVGARAGAGQGGDIAPVAGRLVALLAQERLTRLKQIR